MRATVEMVEGLRREEVGREEGVRWIEEGEWDRRIREREAARVCKGVVEGFERVCEGWRERLLKGEAGVGGGGGLLDVRKGEVLAS